MKRWTANLVVAAILILGCAGCLEMTTPAAIETTTGKMDELMISVDAYQDIATKLFDRMEKDELVDKATAEKIDELNAKVDELQPIIVDGVTAVLETEYSGDKLVDIVTGTLAVNTATAPVNPYAPLIDAILKIILAVTVPTAVVGVNSAVKNAKAANKANAKYKSHDQGKEAMIKKLKTLPVEEITAGKVELILWDKIGDARMANNVA